jgi:hypothetical protein
MGELGFDWVRYFYPALQAFLSGHSRYFNSEIGNPPWTFVFLAPLGFLSQGWSLIAINFISFTGLAAFFIQKKQKWLVMPFMLSYPFLILLSNANLKGLLLWGLIIGGPVGLLLLMIKPQAAALVGVIWAIKAWKKGGLKDVAILVGPLVVLTILSVIIYPEWIKNLIWFTGRVDGDLTNGFPWLVPLGIALFIAAVRHEREDWAAIATVLIVPYVRPQSWVVPLCLLTLYNPIEGIAAGLSTWLVYCKVVIGK